MVANTSERMQLGYARIAGFLLLFVTAVNLAGLAITSPMVVAGNFAQTAQHIVASEHLYRIGLLGELAASCGAMLLGFSLYVLLRPVNSHLALFALLWRVAEAILGGVGVLFNFTALNIYTGSVIGLDLSERQGMVSLLSHGFSADIVIAAVFFSFGSIIFFYLLFRSRFIPRLLSLAGVLASIIFSIVTFGILILPERAAMLQLGWAPLLVAETLAGLWLLFVGANFKYWRSSAEESALKHGA